METVEQITTSDIITVRPETTLLEAAKTLLEYEVIDIEGAVSHVISNRKCLLGSEDSRCPDDGGHRRGISN